MKDIGFISSVVVTLLLLMILAPFGTSLFHVSFRSGAIREKTKADIEQYHRSQAAPASVVSQPLEELESVHAVGTYVAGVAYGSKWLKSIPVRIACYPKTALAALLALIVFAGCWIALVILPPPVVTGNTSVERGWSEIQWTNGEGGH